jgi:hypothetical protein
MAPIRACPTYGRASRAMLEPAVNANRCAIYYPQLPALFLPSKEA